MKTAFVYLKKTGASPTS